MHVSPAPYRIQDKCSVYKRAATTTATKRERELPFRFPQVCLVKARTTKSQKPKLKRDEKMPPTTTPPTSSPLQLKLKLKLPRVFMLASIAALACASLLHPHAAHARSLPMLSNLRSLTTASAAATSGSDGDHAYFRPPADETSGFPNNTRKYHRAPCPCMNMLANHGYFPRDGKNLTPKLVVDVLVRVLNLDRSLAETLANTLPPVFTLADLGKHNFIEHDASLVHDDAYFKGDPSHVNHTLANDLFARAGGKDDQLITKRVLAHFRAARERDCKKRDPEYDFGLKRQGAAYAEAAAFLIVIGDYDSETISVKDARSFLVDEKFPDGFQKSKTTVTTATALYLAARIKFLASWPWAVVATE